LENGKGVPEKYCMVVKVTENPFKTEICGLKKSQIRKNCRRHNIILRCSLKLNGILPKILNNSKGY